MIIVSYYTDKYSEIVKDLVASVERFGLRSDIRKMKDRGSWQANTSAKPEFIKEMLKVHPNETVVWVDADAVFLESPCMLYDLECDIAAHMYRGRELLGGTVLFGPKSQYVVDTWLEEIKNNPTIWEQKNLAKAVQKTNCDFKELPPEYCFIYDLSKRHYPRTIPVIEHHQASRKFNENSRWRNAHVYR